jgi:phage-related protein
MGDQAEKVIEWMGSTLKDLRRCPDDVKDAFGYALHLAQSGARYPGAVSMKGSLRGVTEIRVDDDGETYRAMYTAKLAGVVYVLNVFQKKSTQGIKTPQHELDLTLERLKLARTHHERHYQEKK